MWREALLLVGALAANHQPIASSDARLVRLLDRTVWIDIGLGRNFSSLTPAQAAEIKRCKEPTMAFEKAGNGWVQSFYTGLEMRTVYASASLKEDRSGKTVLLYAAGKPSPAETLHIAPAGDKMVEQTRGFRPRTFLKCNPIKPAPRQH